MTRIRSVVGLTDGGVQLPSVVDAYRVGFRRVAGDG